LQRGKQRQTLMRGWDRFIPSAIGLIRHGKQWKVGGFAAMCKACATAMTVCDAALAQTLCVTMEQSQGASARRQKAAKQMNRRSVLFAIVAFVPVVNAMHAGIFASQSSEGNTWPRDRYEGPGGGLSTGPGGGLYTGPGGGASTEPDGGMYSGPGGGLSTGPGGGLYTGPGGGMSSGPGGGLSTGPGGGMSTGPGGGLYAGPGGGLSTGPGDPGYRSNRPPLARDLSGSLLALLLHSYQEAGLTAL
jgi:hypothetical protein